MEFISVTHSIADCYAICIKTPAATILHSGDFKVDLTPVDGEGFERFNIACPREYLKMALDSLAKAIKGL